MKGLFLLIFFPLIFLVGLFYVGGFVFSIIMFIDCLRREHSSFKNTFTKDGEYDKIIWALLILVGMSIFHLGAILYFFIVRKGEKNGLKIVCTECKTELKEEWKVCPMCGKKR